MKSYADLEKFSRGIGIDLFGVADIRGIKQDFLLTGRILAKIERAVSLGCRLSQGILEELTDAPDRLYFHHYKTLNAFLDQAAFQVAHYIQQKGFLALPIPASQIVDWEKQKGHLSHKKIGFLAGIGWIGRNNLLVHRHLGSQFRLVTILTDMPLKASKATKENCHTCRACIVACPAKAIKEGPLDFAAELCFAKLREFQRQRLADQYICGLCVKACKGK